MPLMLYRKLKKRFLIETRFTTDDATITPNCQAVCLLPECGALSKALSLPVQCQGKADRCLRRRFTAAYAWTVLV